MMNTFFGLSFFNWFLNKFLSFFNIALSPIMKYLGNIVIIVINPIKKCIKNEIKILGSDVNPTIK